MDVAVALPEQQSQTYVRLFKSCSSFLVDQKLAREMQMHTDFVGSWARLCSWIPWIQYSFKASYHVWNIPSSPRQYTHFWHPGLFRLMFVGRTDLRALALILQVPLQSWISWISVSSAFLMSVSGPWAFIKLLAGLSKLCACTHKHACRVKWLIKTKPGLCSCWHLGLCAHYLQLLTAQPTGTKICGVSNSWHANLTYLWACLPAGT